MKWGHDRNEAGREDMCFHATYYGGSYQMRSTEIGLSIVTGQGRSKRVWTLFSRF